MKNILKKIFTSREFILLFIISIIVIFIGNQSEYFFTLKNISGLLYTISYYSIIAIGMTILMVSGSFDISTGTHITFLAMVLGVLLVNGVPVPIAIMLTVLVGAIDGFIMGFISVKYKVDAFITTLGAMFIFEGLAYVIGIISVGSSRDTYTPSFTGFPESFNNIAGGTLFGIQYINYYMLVIGIIFGILLVKNVFFRQNFYIGGNESSARLGGIRVDLLKIFNFTLVSTLVAISAILRSSRTGAASVFLGGPMFGVTVIVAVIIGGASLTGGVGSIPGTFLGVVLIIIIRNGIDLVGINPFYSQIFVGGILLIAVIIDRLAKRNELN